MLHENHIDKALVVTSKDVYRGVCVVWYDWIEMGRDQYWAKLRRAVEWPLDAEPR